MRTRTMVLFALLASAGVTSAETWLGGVKTTDNRVLAVARRGSVVDIWLKDGQLRTAPASVITGGTLKYDDEHIEGNVRLVRLTRGDEARFEELWRDGFLAPESYLALADAAARRRDDARAFTWLQRGRADKRRMSDALLLSGRNLQRLRRSARFAEIYIDPVAAHPELSQRTYPIRIDHNVRIPMRDKIATLADIYRPDAPGRFPVILIRTPYGRGPEIPPDGVGHFAARGYVVVIESVRGTAGSEGEFHPWINERKDGYDSIDWVSRKRWSTGRVGMMGLSYLGQAQWAAAVEAHPALKCIIPEVSGSDHFLDTPYDHGVLRLSLLPWARGMTPRARNQPPWPKLNDDLLGALPLSKLDEIYIGKTLPVWQELLERDTSDKWSAANFLGDLSRVTIPALHISGWWDGEAIATTINYTSMRALGRDNQRLIYGPWEHVWNQSTKTLGVEHGPSAKIDFQSLAVRWFDQWLKQKDVDVESIPPVQIFVTGVNEWRSMKNWPDPSARAVAFHLDGRRLTESTAGTSDATYGYDPATVKTAGNGILPDDDTTLNIDPAAKDMLVYETDPFAAATTFAAPAALDLSFTTTAHDVDFFVILFDRDASGVARALTGPAKMRMKYIDGFDSPHPLTPGAVYRVKLDLRPFAHRFEKGHRLGMLIRSEWFPSYDRNLGTGEPIKDATRMKAGVEQVLRDTTLRIWELR